MPQKATAVAGPFRAARSSAMEPPPPIQSEQEIFAFEINEFGKFISSTARDATSPIKDTLHGLAPLLKDMAAQPIKEGSTTVQKLMSRMGLTGTARIAVDRGRKYVVLNGYAGLRTLLKGPRYRPDNVKVVKLLLTNQGRAIAAVKGVPFTFVLVACADAINYFLTDERERQNLGLTITVDMAKNIVATIAAVTAAAAVGAVTAVAIVPVAVGIAVAVAVALTLDKIAPTEDLVKALEKQRDSLEVEVGRMMWEIERGIMNWMQITPYPY